jgi:hypothetical protein
VRPSGLAFGLALAVRPAGSLEAPRARVGPEDPFCAAVKKDLRVPLRVEGTARTMRGVPAQDYKRWERPVAMQLWLAGLAGTQFNVGFELSGQRVTLRMEGTQMAVVGHDGTLLRTLPCPVLVRDRHRLRGARRAASIRAPSPTSPVTVQRRVSQRGQIMAATQRIQVGMIHARKMSPSPPTTTHSISTSTARLSPLCPAPAAGRSTVTRPTPPSSHAVRADGGTGLLCTS